MPHAAMHMTKGEQLAAAQTPAARAEPAGLLAICWLLAAGIVLVTLVKAGKR